MGVSIQPGDDYVLVEQEKAASRTASGIYIPESAAEKPKAWTILAVGANVKRYKVGEKVFFKAPYDAVDASIGKDEYKLVDQLNIVGKQTK